MIFLWIQSLTEDIAPQEAFRPFDHFVNSRTLCSIAQCSIFLTSHRMNPRNWVRFKVLIYPSLFSPFTPGICHSYGLVTPNH